jgi:hypothetical protein
MIDIPVNQCQGIYEDGSSVAVSVQVWDRLSFPKVGCKFLKELRFRKNREPYELFYCPNTEQDVLTMIKRDLHSGMSYEDVVEKYGCPHKYPR